jgi:ectoine hydroxylase
VLAVVGNRPVLASQVDEELFSRQAQGVDLPDDPKQLVALRREVTSSIVDEELLVHQSSEVMRRLCHHPKVVAIARQLLGSDVYIHQSRINYKGGFRGKEFYWHSDFETWHVEDGVPAMRMVSCSISLTPNTPHNGPLMIIPGSHQRFVACVGETPDNHYKKSLKSQEVGVPDDESLTQLVNDFGITAPTGLAGSVTFFECNIMHGSNSNITPLPRSNVFVVYNSVHNTPVDPFCGLAPRPNFIAERIDFAPAGLPEAR